MDDLQQYRLAAAEVRAAAAALCRAMRRMHGAALVWDPAGDQHDAEAEGVVAEAVAELHGLISEMPGAAELLGGALFGLQRREG